MLEFYSKGRYLRPTWKYLAVHMHLAAGIF